EDPPGLALLRGGRGGAPRRGSNRVVVRPESLLEVEGERLSRGAGEIEGDPRGGRRRPDRRGQLLDRERKARAGALSRLVGEAREVEHDRRDSVQLPERRGRERDG